MSLIHCAPEHFHVSEDLRRSLPARCFEPVQDAGGRGSEGSEGQVAQPAFLSFFSRSRPSGAPEFPGSNVSRALGDSGSVAGLVQDGLEEVPATSRRVSFAPLYVAAQ